MTRSSSVVPGPIRSFPEPNGGNDIFSDFQPQDQIDGTLFGNELQAIEASRLGNGRTLVEFVGANTTVQLSGVISPERLVAEADDLLVNFPAGVEVRVAGADAGAVIGENDVDEVEEVEEVVEEEVEVVEEVEEVEVVNNNNGVVGDATAFFRRWSRYSPCCPGRRWRMARAALTLPVRMAEILLLSAIPGMTTSVASAAMMRS